MEKKKWEAGVRLLDLLTRYRTLYGERILGLKKHGAIHLHGSTVRYVYPYYRVKELDKIDQKEAARIRMFWKFMDGERRYYPAFYELTLRAVRQLLWVTKVTGPFELVTVPGSDPFKSNPMEGICREISKKERFILASAIDGTGLIKRTKKMIPVHKGGRYSIPQIMDSLALTRPIKAANIVLVDDMVYSGKTILACISILKEHGAKRVYPICLFGYKREDNTQGKEQPDR